MKGAQENKGSEDNNETRGSAAPVRFIVDAEAAVQYKNIELPDGLKELGVLDFSSNASITYMLFKNPSLTKNSFDKSTQFSYQNDPIHIDLLLDRKSLRRTATLFRTIAALSPFGCTDACKNTHTPRSLAMV